MTSPSASARRSATERALRAVEIRNDIGVRNSIAAVSSGGSEAVRK